MKRLPIAGVALLLFCVQLLSAQLLPPKNATAGRVSLNGNWKFKLIPSAVTGNDSLFFEPAFNVSEWKEIKVPGHWDLQGFTDPFYGKVKIEANGLYRRNITIPPSWKDKPVYICFDGVLFGYTVWVNGHLAGEFASAYNRKTFDISSFVQPGANNTVAVKVTRMPKGFEFDINDCWTLSGIFRDVTVFSVQPIHMQEMVVKTLVNSKSASVSLRSFIKRARGVQFSQTLSVSAKLFNPTGNLVKEFAVPLNPLPKADGHLFETEVRIDDPLLWTAETPHLYTVELELKDGGQVLQKHREKIGIRQVGWENGILTLNGQPIKLRGVNHHDLSPVNGRAMTEAELLKDLTVARDANINYIRTSHYPPNPRLLDLCDSMGFYVMDEVPFGFGEDHMNDTAYQQDLIDRAMNTYLRDKNHPSVIIWSIGNENPLTPVTYKTGQRMQDMDMTRPICFPMIGSYFANNSKKFPDSIAIYAPHYPNYKDLKEWPSRFNHPMIITEYAHSFGLDFDRMQEQWETMYATPRLAGGSVWHLFDQGILRKRTPTLTKEEASLYVWKDSTWYFDTGDIQGMDGLVYTDRTPQVDYWQVRKVYTPVKALEDTLQYDAVKKQLAFRLNNRYDFTNLSAVRCTWQLTADNKVIANGVSALQCAPHDTTTVFINVNLPANLSTHYNLLQVRFTNKRNYTFYEKVFAVQYKQPASGILQNIAGTISKPVHKNNSFATSNYRFSWSQQGDQLQLTNKQGVVLIKDGMYARVNRKPTVAARLKKLYTFMLTKQNNTVSVQDGNRIQLNGKYLSDSATVPNISNNLEYYFSDSGYIQVKYRLVPDSAMKTTALETGVSFLIPSTLTEFRWIGKGPYAGYPGKNILNELGFHHLNSGDLYFAGNRENVDCALFSDAKGNGFALITNQANIAVERTDNGILVSHNALVSGRFNKGNNPELYYTFENIKAITGSFYIVPLTLVWPSLLQQLLGPSGKVVKPFKPFYNSYDQ